VAGKRSVGGRWCWDSGRVEAVGEVVRKWHGTRLDVGVVEVEPEGHRRWPAAGGPLVVSEAGGDGSTLC
jgi:hypothetical protein